MTVQTTDRPPDPPPAPVSKLDFDPTRDLTINQMMELTKVLGPAQLLPASVRGKPADLLLIMLYGQELGLTLTQALRTINAPGGTPQMSGQLWLVKIRERGHTYELTDHTNESCTCTITRGDTKEKFTETFTIQDAERMGLCKIMEDGTTRARSTQGKPLPWETTPKRMVGWRSITNCATIACPEVAMGFSPDLPEDREPEPDLTEVVQAKAETGIKFTNPAEEYAGIAEEHGSYGKVTVTNTETAPEGVIITAKVEGGRPAGKDDGESAEAGSGAEKQGSSPSSPPDQLKLFELPDEEVVTKPPPLSKPVKHRPPRTSDD